MRYVNAWDSAGAKAVRGLGLERLSATPPKAVLEVRTCEAKGCKTVLSKYNASTTCWQHERPHRYYHRVRDREASHSAA
jgi:hypothetical protein